MWAGRSLGDTNHIAFNGVALVVGVADLLTMLVDGHLPFQTHDCLEAPLVCGFGSFGFRRLGEVDDAVRGDAIDRCSPVGVLDHRVQAALLAYEVGKIHG